MQRLRVRFSRGEEIKFISHLDMIRLWQRAFHRAGIPLAYSEGFNPHPRISLASPLAIGVTSETELMDIWCSRWVSPHSFVSAMERELPPGVKILHVYSIALTLPSLQSLVRHAEYLVEVESERTRQEVEAAIDNLIAAEQLPWQHQRDTGPKSYDLRTLVDDLWLTEEHGGRYIIGMRLVCSDKGSGRPEQVTAALGFASRPLSIHRARFILETS